MICRMLIDHDLVIYIVFVLFLHYQDVLAILLLHLVLHAYKYKAIMSIYSLSLRIDAQHIGKKMLIKSRNTCVGVNM